jgi:hypothetical protein
MKDNVAIMWCGDGCRVIRMVKFELEEGRFGFRTESLLPNGSWSGPDDISPPLEVIDCRVRWWCLWWHRIRHPIRTALRFSGLTPR